MSLSTCFFVCILFFVGLLSNIFNMSCCIMLNGVMVCELQIIWYEKAVALFKALSQHKSVSTEEKQKHKPE